MQYLFGLTKGMAIIATVYSYIYFFAIIIKARSQAPGSYVSDSCFKYDYRP